MEDGPFYRSDNFMDTGSAMRSSPHALEVAVGQTAIMDKQARSFNNTARWLHFAAIDRFSTGELLATIWMVPDENYLEGCFSGYRISRDRGKTWSRRYTRGPMGWCKYAFNDGSIMELSYLIAADPPGQGKDFTGILTWFTDGGRKVCDEEMRVHFPTAAKLRREPTVPPGVELPVMSEVQSGFVFCRSILEMHDGSLLASMYGQFEGDTLDRCILVRSEDRGRTWEYYSTICTGETVQAITGWANLEGANEVSVVPLSDGRLLAVFRTRSGNLMHQCWSTDQGKTWTRPVSTGVPGVLPKILRLNNGALACSYGRPGVHVMFSPDGTGSEWTHHTKIFSETYSRDFPEGRGSTCYTDMIEVSLGEILLMYDTRDQNVMDIRITTISLT